MFSRNIAKLLLFAFVFSVIGCDKNPFQNQQEQKPQTISIALSAVPAQRLNYRFEVDVPEPTLGESTIPVQSDERNEAIQKSFDENRPKEVLDRTITSPDKKRVLVVYRKEEDIASEFRLDMYSVEGDLLKKITHSEMAVHFPDTIRWSPDSINVAFIAKVRSGKSDVEKNDTDKKEDKKEEKKAEPADSPTPDKTESNNNTETDTNTNSETNTNSNSETSTETSTESLEPPKNVLTFRTEQIYLCNLDGGDVKPLTQNEGLIYFYFAWAPNNSALAALATPYTEWRFRKGQMETAGERFVPAGRPRLIKKNGIERLLDDYPTPVQPVWSPDSAKVAVAFNKQVRLYDAEGEPPTQAAILLKNQLLLASKKYEEDLAKEGEESNSNVSENSEDKEKDKKTENSNANSNVKQNTSTLPDAKSLVSFQPIISLEWIQDSMLYLQTGYIKSYIENEEENRRSYLRWHRLVLSPQAIAVERQNKQQ